MSATGNDLTFFREPLALHKSALRVSWIGASEPSELSVVAVTCHVTPIFAPP